MHILEALHKVSNMTSKGNHSSIVPIPRSTTSSINKRCVKAREDAILIPLIKPFDFTSLISKLRPSITSMNKREDKGKPFLIPLEEVKKFEGVPLTNTKKLADERKPIIQYTTCKGTPI